MSILLNCEGEPCPNPVLRCKRLLDEQTPDELRVVVDNDAARENVCRFLASKGMHVRDICQDKHLWTITAVPQAGNGQTRPETGSHPDANQASASRILVFLSSEVVGQGDDVLGARLMGNFLNTLPELGESLWRIIMLNGAVKLAVAGSPALETLKKLEAAGVSILVCGTCLEFFHLMDRKEIGQVTNMLDVVTSQQVADKIITV